MKKIYGFLLVMMLALTCVGCSKTDSENKNSQSGIPVTESESIEADSQMAEIVEDKITTEETEEDDTSESTETVVVPPADDEMVLILDYIPDMVIDLKYATTDNFTGQVIYDDDDAYLRYGTVKKLMQVQDELKKYGYKLLLWDGYRPVAAQYKLWDICPDSTYVANPNNGFSKHSRGNTVDITLLTLDGQPVEMPTGFDDFTKKADRDYGDVSVAAAEHSQMLEDIMEAAGFKGYSGEWWHYSDNTEYPVVE